MLHFRGQSFFIRLLGLQVRLQLRQFTVLRTVVAGAVEVV